MRLGVLDVGSNTVHLLVVDARPGARPLAAYSHKTELRPGRAARRRRPVAEAGRRPADQGDPGRACEVAEDQGVEELLALRHLRDARGDERREVIAASARDAPVSIYRCCPARTRRG